MPTQRDVFNITVHVFERILLLPAVDLNFQPLVVIEKKTSNEFLSIYTWIWRLLVDSFKIPKH